MAPDLRSITDCAIPAPLLPAAELDDATAARVAASGLGTFYGQLGHAPGLIDKWLAFYQPVVTGGEVGLTTKEQCGLRIAAGHGGRVCLGGRVREAEGTPVVDDDDVDAVLAGRFDDPRFTPRETAALTFTETFRVDHSRVD